MRIESRKIASEPKRFTLKLSDDDFSVEVCGSFYKISNGLIKVDSRIVGEIELICDISGESFTKSLDEHIVILASDGIYNSNHANDDDFGIVEFFDGYLDLDSIFRGEIESIKLEYHTKD